MATSDVAPAFETWAEDVRQTVAKETRDLVEAKRRDNLVNLLDSSLAFADRNIRDITQVVNASAARCGMPGVACKAGCAACCHVRVSILPAEAFNIARHVKAQFSEKERALLLERLRSYVESIAALPVEGRMRHVLACPFLGGQRQCTIYEARPLACRMHHSLSREACEDPVSPIPVIEDYVKATVPVMEGIYEGCAEAGTKPEELEFAPAMLVTLEEEDAEAMWLAGEEVFTGAVDLYLREYVQKLMG